MGRVRGAKEVIRDLVNFGKEAERYIAQVTEVAAREIQGEAKQNVPLVLKYNYGNETPSELHEVAQSISVSRQSEFKWEVSQNSTLGAYVEFGTGAYVEVADEWKDIAWTYYVNGKGLMLPQPYFYPAWVQGKKQYVQDLEDVLEMLTRQKYGK